MWSSYSIKSLMGLIPGSFSPVTARRKTIVSRARLPLTVDGQDHVLQLDRMAAVATSQIGAVRVQQRPSRTTSRTASICCSSASERHVQHPLPLQGPQGEGPRRQGEDGEQNRILFGRTKAEKDKAKAEKALAERRIEAHRRDREPGDG